MQLHDPRTGDRTHVPRSPPCSHDASRAFRSAPRAGAAPAAHLFLLFLLARGLRAKAVEPSARRPPNRPHRRCPTVTPAHFSSFSSLVLPRPSWKHGASKKRPSTQVKSSTSNGPHKLLWLPQMFIRLSFKTRKQLFSRALDHTEREFSSRNGCQHSPTPLDMSTERQVLFLSRNCGPSSTSS